MLTFGENGDVAPREAWERRKDVRDTAQKPLIDTLRVFNLAK
jgi:hypothetical protein